MPNLGLYYYKARFYSPTLGRFMQAVLQSLGDLMRSAGDFEAALALYQRSQSLYDYAEQIAPDRD